MEKQEEMLMKDALISGDRPSLLVMGMVVARALERFGQAFITSDVLGRVVVMPKESVTLLAKPLLKEEDLDAFDEDKAISLMAQEGREDAVILEYLRGRALRLEGRDDK